MAATAPHLIHPDYILREGLKFAKVDEARQQKRCTERNVSVFKAHYGKHPLHLARVWRDLQVYGILTVDEAKDRSNFVGFLMANCFLKLYEGADVRGPRFGLFHKEELGRLTWKFVDGIAALKEHKVKCPTVWPAKLGASIDGTQIRTNEPRDPDMRRNPKNYAYKHNFAGLNYQIALALWTSECWYATVGHSGNTHDMTAVREEFIDMVPDGCRVIADKAYTGKYAKEKKIFAVYNSLDDDEVFRFKAAAKARQEHFNKRLKDYGCLNKQFIHGVKKHSTCFTAVLVLVQYAITDTSPHGEPLNTL